MTNKEARMHEQGEIKRRAIRRGKGFLSFKKHPSSNTKNSQRRMLLLASCAMILFVFSGIKKQTVAELKITSIGLPVVESFLEREEVPQGIIRIAAGGRTFLIYHENGKRITKVDAVVKEGILVFSGKIKEDSGNLTPQVFELFAEGLSGINLYIDATERPITKAYQEDETKTELHETD